jgi:hypothetical protein
MTHSNNIETDEVKTIFPLSYPLKETARVNYLIIIDHIPFKAFGFCV